MRAYTTQRYGKSLMARLARDYVKTIGGKIVSDETANGLRTEIYRLPSGHTWMFVKKLDTGNTGDFK
jgi:hypothetical protein